MRKALPIAALGVMLGALMWPLEAGATGVQEFPDNGSEQMGRGGAWMVRASDPLAVMFNPAGLAGQPSRITIQNNTIFEHTCFTRLKSALDTSQDPLVDGTGHYPRVCNDIQPNINPQFGGTLRINERLGVGLLVIGPSSGGEKNFPEFVNDGAGTPQAPPNRYLLISQKGIILFPTVGVGYEIIDGLRIGASLSWGFAKLKLATAAPGVNTDRATPSNDVRALLQVQDYFIPGFTLGAIYSPTPQIDLGGWYKWSDAIRASGDAGTAANYYTRQNAQGNDSGVRYADTIFEDCGTGLPTKACGSGDNAKVKITIPMEAKIGIRWHKPRARGEEELIAAHSRDPIKDDVFDLEANLTWANDSAAKDLQVRFPGDDTGKGLLPVSIPGSELPPNGDQHRGYQDVFGVRVGGDYNVVPNKVALRAGAFYESSALDPAYQSIEFDAAYRIGLAAGGTVRIADKVELMLGYGHVFFGTQTRDDPKAGGITALAGTSCNGSNVVPPSSCSDGAERYRTKWPVNLGTITNAVNVINVGLAYKF